jgi:hypothetical protein
MIISASLSQREDRIAHQQLTSNAALNWLGPPSPPGVI